MPLSNLATTAVCRSETIAYPHWRCATHVASRVILKWISLLRVQMRTLALWLAMHLPASDAFLRIAVAPILHVLVAWSLFRAARCVSAATLQAKASKAESKRSCSYQRTHNERANHARNGWAHRRAATLGTGAAAARGHVLAPCRGGTRLADLAPVHGVAANRRHLVAERKVRDAAAAVARVEEREDAERVAVLRCRAVHETHAQVLRLGEARRLVRVDANQLKDDGGARRGDVAHRCVRHVVAV